MLDIALRMVNLTFQSENQSSVNAKPIGSTMPAFYFASGMNLNVEKKEKTGLVNVTELTGTRGILTAY